MQALASPRDGTLPSPRVRPGFDGVLSDTWSSRRRTSETVPKVGGGANRSDGENKGPDIKEEEEDTTGTRQRGQDSSGGSANPKVENGTSHTNTTDQLNGQLSSMSLSSQGDSQAGTAAPNKAPPGPGDLAEIEWSYLDPQGQTQGGWLLKLWFDRLPHGVIIRALQS